MRRNFLHNEIQQFTPERFEDLLKNNLQAFVAFMDDFSKRELTITKAAIGGLDRKLLFTWKKHGLMPFRSNIDKEKVQWNRFSFIDICWLKVLVAFRNQGVGIDRLKMIRDHMFPEHFITELIGRFNIDDFNKAAPAFVDMAKEKGFIEGNQLKPIKESDELKEETQMSPFSMLLYTTLYTKANHVLYVDEEGRPDVINIDKKFTDSSSFQEEVFTILNKPSVTTVNFTHIIAELSDTHAHFFKNLPQSQSTSDAD